jgi:putative transposase
MPDLWRHSIRFRDFKLARELSAAGSPRFHVHFTPAYASWLNQVELWLNRITQQALRRGTFSSVKDLVTKIDLYAQNSNRNAQPFVSTATADSIFAKVERLCDRIYGTTP